MAEQRAELAAAEGEGHVDFPLHEGIEYVVGVFDGEPVACGALQPLEPGVGEVKRMYVRPAYRGRGLSGAILAAVEDLAVAKGIDTLRLETGRFLAPALGLYILERLSGDPSLRPVRGPRGERVLPEVPRDPRSDLNRCRRRLEQAPSADRADDDRHTACPCGFSALLLLPFAALLINLDVAGPSPSAAAVLRSTA